MELCEAVREAREARGWSEAHVARMVGVGRAAISKIETGKSKGGSGTLLKLLAVLEIDPATVTESATQPPAVNLPTQHHPGVEALLADAEECARWRITDDEAAELRAMVLARPVMTLERARAYLLLQRAPD